MAKGKKKQSQVKAEPPPMSQLAGETQAEAQSSSIMEYVIHFVIFVLFCLISALLTRVVTGYTLGLDFFFGVLILGFFFVCVFSYFHDRFYRDDDEIDTGP